jgi:hypothetical protein
VTANEIQRRFPKASNAFIRANLDSGETPSPVAKPTVRHEPLAAQEGEASYPGRVRVCVISYRRRLTDPDNLCPKYFVDCLRDSKLIRDDSAEQIDLSVSQEKVKRKEDEGTLISITAISGVTLEPQPGTQTTCGN